MNRIKNISVLAVLLIAAIFVRANPQNKNYEKNSADSSKYNIENCVNRFSFEDTIGTEVGYQYWFADKKFADGKTLKLSVVAPHSATHAPHAHAEDEFFFVLEGIAEFYLDGKTKTGGPYTSFYCPSNVKHGIRNIGDKELKYLVIKKYIQN